MSCKVKKGRPLLTSPMHQPWWITKWKLVSPTAVMGKNKILEEIITVWRHILRKVGAQICCVKELLLKVRTSESCHWSIFCFDLFSSRYLFNCWVIIIIMDLMKIETEAKQITINNKKYFYQSTYHSALSLHSISRITYTASLTAWNLKFIHTYTSWKDNNFMLHFQNVVISYTFNPPVFRNVLMLPPFNVCTALTLTALCHGEGSLSSEQHFPAPPVSGLWNKARAKSKWKVRASSPGMAEWHWNQ